MKTNYAAALKFDPNQPRDEDGRWVQLGNAMERLFDAFGADWMLALQKLHKVGAFQDVMSGRLDLKALAKTPTFAAILKLDLQPVAKVDPSQLYWILKFDPNQQRDPAGTPTGGQFARSNRSPLEQKRRDFIALIKRGEHQDKPLNRMRTEVRDAWMAWDADTKNRKKPLKQDGAAAKKLDSYKKAKTLEEAFLLKHDEAQKKTHEFNTKAKELLKVAPHLRSRVTFKENPASPLAHPNLTAFAKKYLETFKQFDGSGAFEALQVPADKVAGFKEVFGKTDLVKTKDGNYEVPTTIGLSRATSGRAHADWAGVHLGGGRDLDHQVYHEVAHLLEMRQHGALKAAIEFRDRQAASPREVFKLNTVNPALGDEEVALKGNFPDVYSGKVYPHDVATEIVSTGVESYIMDPINFYRDRPEHFNLIFDIMQGKYRD